MLAVLCLTTGWAAAQRPVDFSDHEHIPGRVRHAMASDEARERVVLFGGATVLHGSNVGNARFGDTWEWNGREAPRRRRSSSDVRPRRGLLRIDDRVAATR